ncbi:MAG TPA: DUF6544 family protein [Bacteroidales bacterium]|nr:DUF6544 family protein [Bacteroidales bacterium]
MKYIFTILLLIHGLIHIMGFSKAFGLARLEQLTLPVSRIAGIAWLAAGLLFIAAAIAYFSNKSIWAYLAAPAVIISVILIVMAWKDARFGLIPDIIVALVIVISVAITIFNKQTGTAFSDLLTANQTKQKSNTISESELAALPFPVRNWLVKSGATNRERDNKVWLQQNAVMELKPGQEKGYKATAQQVFSVSPPAFVWAVKMDMMPALNVYGRDQFIDGKGRMLIKMAGIFSLVDETGNKINEGSLQRYLAEIVWFPSAALSPYITWEEIDSLSVRATMMYKGTKGSGVFRFNNNGDFVQFSTMRYKGNDPDAKRYKWVVNARKYDKKNGIRIPVKSDVTWELKDGNWTWMKIEISDILYNDDVEKKLEIRD